VSGQRPKASAQTISQTIFRKRKREALRSFPVKQLVYSNFKNTGDGGQKEQIRIGFSRFPFRHRLLTDPKLISEGSLRQMIFSAQLFYVFPDGKIHESTVLSVSNPCRTQKTARRKGTPEKGPFALLLTLQNCREQTPTAAFYRAAAFAGEQYGNVTKRVKNIFSPPFSKNLYQKHSAASLWHDPIIPAPKSFVKTFYSTVGWITGENRLKTG
jgi:hypothetical protein